MAGRAPERKHDNKRNTSLHWSPLHICSIHMSSWTTHSQLLSRLTARSYSRQSCFVLPCEKGQVWRCTGVLVGEDERGGLKNCSGGSCPIERKKNERRRSCNHQDGSNREWGRLWKPIRSRHGTSGSHAGLLAESSRLVPTVFCVVVEPQTAIDQTRRRNGTAWIRRGG